MLQETVSPHTAPPPTPLLAASAHLTGLTKIVTYPQWLYAVIIIYNIVTNVVKLAFLLQYRRFITDLWTLRICNWSAAAVIPVITVVIVTTMATACFPLAIIVPSTAGRCLPQTPVWYCTASVNIITDLFVFILPLPTIIGLKKISTKERVVLILMFSLGFLYVYIVSSSLSLTHFLIIPNPPRSSHKWFQLGS